MIRGGPTIVQNGLILDWDISTTKSYVPGSTSITDISYNGTDGLVGNPANVVSYNAIAGGALQFSGNQGAGYVTGVATGGVFNITGSVTCESWFYLTISGAGGSTQDNHLAGKYANAGAGANQSWLLFRSTTDYRTLGSGNIGPNVGQIGWLTTSNGVFGTSGNNLIGSVTTIQPNKWYQVVGTYDAATTGMAVYLNGALERAATRTGLSASIQSNSLPFSIGGNVGDNNRYMNGYIGITRLYSRALSAAEVAQNWNANRGRYGV